VANDIGACGIAQYLIAPHFQTFLTVYPGGADVAEDPRGRGCARSVATDQPAFNDPPARGGGRHRPRLGEFKFRATDIAAYPKNGWTQLYDWRHEWLGRDDPETIDA
jgi:hypothetical protein